MAQIPNSIIYLKSIFDKLSDTDLVMRGNIKDWKSFIILYGEENLWTEEELKEIVKYNDQFTNKNVAKWGDVNGCNHVILIQKDKYGYDYKVRTWNEGKFTRHFNELIEFLEKRLND